MAKLAAPKRPKPAKSAELIIRQGFLIDATGKGPHAIPEVVILGNAEGLKFLSEVFAHLAEKAKSRRKATGDESIQLPRLDHPINTRLSDDLDFRFAALTPTNRKALFKQFGVDMKSRQEGSLFDRYREVLAHFGRLSAQMEREDRRADRIPTGAQ